MITYSAKIQDWPVFLDAKTLPQLRQLAKQFAKENNLQSESISLVEVQKIIDKTVKLKRIKVKL